MSDNHKFCGSCFFWTRICHPFDFKLGRCELFEREMPEAGHCSMWDGRVTDANVINLQDYVTDANKT
jgi:hypothetical protein